MKSSLIALLPLAALAIAPSCTPSKATDAPKVSVAWEGVNLPADSTGANHYKQTITVTGDLRGVDRIGFNQFARRMQPVNPADTIIEIVPGYYAIGSPAFANATGTDTLTFEIITRGSLMSVCYSPDGFHLINHDGTTEAAAYTRRPLSDKAESYTAGGVDRMPYGDAVYAINERVMPTAARGVYDVVPSFKQVQLGEGESTVNPAEADFKPLAGAEHEGEYRITVADGKMTIEAPEKMWPALQRRITHNFGTEAVTLPNVVITDWPSMPYRGMMIDVARNFQSPEEIRRVLDLMAVYGLNTFHFHLVDDEAWRLEIEALPELTEMGSRRGYAVNPDADFLPQIFAGDGNPFTSAGSANGYYTRQEYIDLLRYADSLGIAVIPEMESPGHARAAIKAMELRARRTGDRSMLLSEEGDTSKYTSAQAFHDNVMNPALDGPYKLMDVLADELIALHNEAGVPLPAIHIGGDEVPHGAWSGSPAVAELMKKEGLKSEKDVHAYFVRKVSENYAKKGIPMSAWQEVALKHADDYNKTVIPAIYSINCWSTLPSQGQGSVVNSIAGAGYPVVLSNVDYFYLDMMYSPHPDERGLSWGGWNDEFTALSGYPARLCTVPGANVLGVQGQIWSETVRDAATLETMLLPKMLGLAERGWNPDSTYTDPAFQAVIVSEIPQWEAAGYTYHVRQPGIKLTDGGKSFTVNSPYPDAVLRYTFDGLTPTESSQEIKAGENVAVGDASQIRVRLWLNGHPSVVSILNTGK